ncbi:MAG: FAD:protein FMN transferase [Anaerolineales bacterium]
MQYHEFRAMNTTVILGVDVQYPVNAFRAAQDFIQQSEQRFSRFLHDSELNALNRSAGTWFYASAEMMDLITSAMEYHLATNGLFNPAILPHLKAAGYTRNIDDIRSYGAGAKPEKSLAPVQSFRDIKLDTDQNRVLLPVGMQIDLGGIAKGWIAEKAAKLLSAYSSVCVANAGGDMFLIGRPNGQNWEVVLEDPLDQTRNVLMLLVEDGAVATSSTTKRIWTQDRQARHHLIDPRSGEPAKSPWLSVTVFAPHAAQAETFAKALLIAGPEGAQTLLDKNPKISFLAVDIEKQIWKSPTEKEKLYEYA